MIWSVNQIVADLLLLGLARKRSENEVSISYDLVKQIREEADANGLTAEILAKLLEV